MQRAILFITIFILLCIFSFTMVFLHFQQSVMQRIQTGGCVDIPATPEYLITGSEADAIAAINHARLFEHLPALHLPANFYHLNAIQQQFILVNLERTDRGLRPFTLDHNLSTIAQAYSMQLSKLRFFSHTSPIGGTFSERINNNPTLANHYTLAAENLAGNPVAGAGPMYEYMYNDTADTCGHRINILSPELTRIGIGMVSDGTYGTISVQEFLAPSALPSYSDAISHDAPPRVSIWGIEDARHKTLYCQVQNITTTTNIVRTTWFLDTIDRPVKVGPFFSLTLARLKPGKHTIYAYAVDGEQQYGMAQYTLVIAPPVHIASGSSSRMRR